MMPIPGTEAAQEVPADVLACGDVPRPVAYEAKLDVAEEQAEDLDADKASIALWHRAGWASLFLPKMTLRVRLHMDDLRQRSAHHLVALVLANNIASYQRTPVCHTTQMPNACVIWASEQGITMDLKALPGENMMWLLDDGLVQLMPQEPVPRLFQQAKNERIRDLEKMRYALIDSVRNNRDTLMEHSGRLRPRDELRILKESFNGSYESAVLPLVRELFQDRSATITALAIGNLSEADSKLYTRMAVASVVFGVNERLGTNMALGGDATKRHIGGKCRVLPRATQVDLVSVDREQGPNNAAMISIPLNEATVLGEVALGLIVTIARSEVYTRLRTKLKLGYGVFTSASGWRSASPQRCCSEHAASGCPLPLIDDAIAVHVWDALEALTDDDFDALRAAHINRLTDHATATGDETSQWWRAVATDGCFLQDQEKVDALKTLTASRLRDLYRESILPSTRSKLVTKVFGTEYLDDAGAPKRLSFEEALAWSSRKILSEGVEVRLEPRVSVRRNWIELLPCER